MLIYESLTGNTRKAAGLIGEELSRGGLDVVGMSPTTDVDLQALSVAELVVVGTWTDGILVVGQKPGRAGRLAQLPAMRGKRAVVYCTYAINPGRTIDKMMGIIGQRGRRRHWWAGAASSASGRRRSRLLRSPAGCRRRLIRQ